MSEDSDQTIWQRVVAGDPRAYGLIWDRHHTRVLRHVVRSGHTAHDADDLTAMAFMEAWRRRSSVRFVDGSLLPWLVVTARNVARNAVRAQRRYSRFLENLPPAPPGPDPLAVVQDENSVEHILRLALDDARPVDGDLLAMTALEGFTVQEAAAALGMSETAAKSRLHRFRSRLRTVLSTDLLIEGGTR